MQGREALISAELFHEPAFVGGQHGTQPRGGWAGLARLGLGALDLLVVGFFLVSSGAVAVLLVQGEAGSLDASQRAFLRLFVAPIPPLAALLLVVRFRDYMALFAHTPVLVLIMFWVAFSVLWSIDPGLSARRALALIAGSLVALHAAMVWDERVLLRRLSWICLAILASCLVFAIAYPGLAWQPHLDNAFRGSFPHKNVLGFFIVISSTVYTVALLNGLVPRWIVLPALIVTMALAVPTKSATAILILGAMFAVQAALVAVRLSRRLAMGLLLVFAGMACFATLFSIVFIDEIAALLGRDLTLTGRTAVWAYVVSMIEARPVLGFGYNVFFDQPANVEFLLAYLQWSVPHSHNGYLEVTLGLGVIGLALMLLLLVQSLLRAVRLVFLTNSCGAQFALVWLIVYALMNISESVMLPGAEPVWIMTCVALGLLWRLGTQRGD